MTNAGFSAVLLDPSAPAPEGVIGRDGSPAGARFDVYRNNVIVGLVEALMATYPTVLALVGEEFFRAAGAIHVRAEPPMSPVLLEYGGGFSAFMEGFEPARVVPYLGDVARLDWARVRAYHAADAPPLDPATLARIAPERLGDVRLLPHPAMHLVRSTHPVVSIWERHQGEPDDGPLPDHGEDVLVTRSDLDVELRRLPPGGAAFVAALAEGRTLAAAAASGEEAARKDAEAFDLAHHLQGILEAGAFAAVGE